MAPRKLPTPEDREEAVRIVLVGLVAGEAPEATFAKLAGLRTRNDTFPAEEFLELASDAIAISGATPGDPIDFEGIRERYLGESRFSGKTQHYKSKYAISAAAMIHGGVYPDLFGDAAWWEADDLWRYSFFALLTFVRAAAERTGRSVEEVVRSIADLRGVLLSTSES